MSACPHCFESLPYITDAYCPYCRESLHEQDEYDKASSDLAPGHAKDSKVDDNPYAAPSSGSSKSNHQSDVILYTELPQECPSCRKKFGEVNFRRRFKRKMRWTTILYMLSVSIGGYLLFAFVLPLILFWPIYFMVMITMLGNAMKWPKTVKMSCSKCDWKRGYKVASTGAKQK
jgi:ribosomal protein L44E